MKYLNYRKSIRYDELERKASHYMATPKDDGVFAHVEGARIVSREGVGFPGFGAIVSECNKVRALGGFTFLQGELYDPRQPFQDIQGIVRSSSVAAIHKDSMRFYIFNAGGDFRSTKHMFHELRRAVKYAWCDKVEVVECEIISDKEVNAAMFNAVTDGHEGIVLRQLKVEDDRHTGFIKVKPYNECDLNVVAIHEGTGNMAGLMSAITVSGQVDGEHVRFKVGSGFSKAMRKWFLENEASIVVGGLVVEVKHSGLNPWPREDDTYALRDATFIKTKEDRKLISESEG